MSNDYGFSGAKKLSPPISRKQKLLSDTNKLIWEYNAHILSLYHKSNDFTKKLIMNLVNTIVSPIASENSKEKAMLELKGVLEKLEK